MRKSCLIAMFFISFSIATCSLGSDLMSICDEYNLFEFTAIGAAAKAVVSHEVMESVLKEYRVDLKPNFAFKDTAVCIQMIPSSIDQKIQAIVPLRAISLPSNPRDSNLALIVNGPKSMIGKECEVDEDYLPGTWGGAPRIDFDCRHDDYYLAEPDENGRRRPVPYPSFPTDPGGFDFKNAYSEPGEGLFNLAKNDWMVYANGSVGVFDGTDIANLFGILARKSNDFRCIYLTAKRLNGDI